MWQLSHLLQWWQPRCRNSAEKVRFTVVAVVKPWHDGRYPFYMYTQASQKPELSFYIWLIKTYFLCYTYRFSFVFFCMMNKCEHLGLVSHSCEIPLTGNLQNQIPSLVNILKTKQIQASLHWISHRLPQDARYWQNRTVSLIKKQKATMRVTMTVNKSS